MISGMLDLKQLISKSSAPSFEIAMQPGQEVVVSSVVMTFQLVKVYIIG
jgi:hypothetical protein